MVTDWAKGRVVLLLMGSLLLMSCGPAAAPPTPRSGATSAPAPTAVPTKVATPTATAAPSPSQLPAPTSRPPAVPPPATPQSNEVVIEIVGESPQHTFIKPGETAVVPYWGEYVVLVHYPYLLGSTGDGAFHPYPMKVDVSPPGWQSQIRNYPNGQTLNLHLLAGAPGRFTVTITDGTVVQPVSFTLDVQQPSAGSGSATAGTGSAPPASTAVVSGTASSPATPVLSDNPAPSTTPAPGQPRSVTLADDGQNIELHTGDRFLLNLGEGFDWTVNVADPSIVSRVVNVTVIQGAQGIYEAKRSGTTTLTATGDLPCRKSQPPCAAPSRLFRIQITVR